MICPAIVIPTHMHMYVCSYYFYSAAGNWSWVIAYCFTVYSASWDALNSRALVAMFVKCPHRCAPKCRLYTVAAWGVHRSPRRQCPVDRNCYWGWEWRYGLDIIQMTASLHPPQWTQACVVQQKIGILETLQGGDWLHWLRIGTLNHLHSGRHGIIQIEWAAEEGGTPKLVLLIC